MNRGNPGVAPCLILRKKALNARSMRVPTFCKHWECAFLRNRCRCFKSGSVFNWSYIVSVIFSVSYFVLRSERKLFQTKRQALKEAFSCLICFLLGYMRYLKFFLIFLSIGKIYAIVNREEDSIKFLAIHPLPEGRGFLARTG